MGESGRQAARRILIVDDDELVLDVIAEFFRSDGYEVTAHTDPARALALITEGAGFDLLVADWRMPVVNGLRLIAAMHQQHPEMPAYLLTGSVERPEIDDPRIVVIVKPFVISRFVEMVRQRLCGQPTGLTFRGPGVLEARQAELCKGQI